MRKGKKVSKIRYEVPYALDICGEVCLKFHAARNTMILCSGKDFCLLLSIFTGFSSDRGYTRVEC